MRNLIPVVIIAFAAISPALAEPPTGSRLGERTIHGLKYTEEQADEESTKMAQCMVTKREKYARGYVEAFEKEAAEKARKGLFSDISCMSFVGLSDMSDTAVFTFPSDVMRGKLAEALLKKERAKVATLAPLPLAKDYSRPWFGASGRDPVIDEMASCVADTNPQGIVGIMATRGYSKEEGAAFGAVVPSIGTCLRVGAKMQANKQSLRAALADALYQRLRTPAPSAESSGATK